MSTSTDRRTWLQGPSAPCENTPSVQHPWRLVLLGAPGVGKGTQADLLHQHLGACHLSTGDVFRYSAKLPVCELSPAIQAAQEYMKRGELVPDSTVWEVVRERLACLHCGGGFILDGFPRTLGQAESLKYLMESENIKLSAVVNYELPIAEIVARLSGRRTCSECKAVYHVAERPPKFADKCDRCDGALFQREDDKPEAVKVRMQTYEHATAPLIEFYDKLGLIMPVVASGTPEEICGNTIASLEARRAAAAARV